MISSKTEYIGEIFGLNNIFGILKPTEKCVYFDEYLKDLELYQNNVPHAKHVPFSKEHNFKCEECGCRVLNHDSYLGEYSCSKCGIVIENVEFSEICNDTHIQQSHGLIEDSAEIVPPKIKPKEVSMGWRGYHWFEQIENYTKTGKIPLTGPLVNANPYKELNGFPKTTKDVCNVLNYRNAYLSQEGSTRWRGYNYKPVNNKIETATKIMESLGFNLEKYPQIVKRIFYILKKHKLTQIHPKKDKSIVITGIVYYVINEFFIKWDPPISRRSGIKNQCSEKEYRIIRSNLNKIKSKSGLWRCQGEEYL